MCYNCGCGNPHDDMGDINNITAYTFDDVAKELNRSLSDFKHHLFHLLEKQKESKFKEIENEEHEITEMFQNAAEAWGQSQEDARKNTYALLASEMK